MIYEVKKYFGLKKTFDSAEYFETENYRRLFITLKEAIGEGLLVALTGIVGSGKTAAAMRLEEDLKKEGEVLVSSVIVVDRNSVKLNMLTFRLFADLATKNDPKIPVSPAIRTELLKEIIRREKKPIALFIDEAHDLSHSGLTSLKKLKEIVLRAGGVISIILIGHPRLKTDLERPFLEEIGGRAKLVELEWIHGQEREYLQWLLSECCLEETRAEDIFTEEAAEVISVRLNTPLQINSYGWKALEAAYLTGQKPVKADTVEEVISRELNDLKARIWRYGYNMKSLCEAIDAKPSEARAFFRGRLSSGRSQELKNEIFKLGIAG